MISRFIQNCMTYPVYSKRFYSIDRLDLGTICQKDRNAPGAKPLADSTLRSVKRTTSLPKLTRNKNEIDPHKK